MHTSEIFFILIIELIAFNVWQFNYGFYCYFTFKLDKIIFIFKILLSFHLKKFYLQGGWIIWNIIYMSYIIKWCCFKTKKKPNVQEKLEGPK
jgi:hypothetical protein